MLNNSDVSKTGTYNVGVKVYVENEKIGLIYTELEISFLLYMKVNEAPYFKYPLDDIFINNSLEPVIYKLGERYDPEGD